MIGWAPSALNSQTRFEIAGLDRTSFLLALGRAKIDAFQITEAELKQEVERGLEARRLNGDAKAAHRRDCQLR